MVMMMIILTTAGWITIKLCTHIHCLRRGTPMTFSCHRVIDIFLLFHLNSTLKPTAPFDCFLAASYLSFDLILPLLPVFMLSYAKWLLAVALNMWTDMRVILIISSNPITSSASLHVCKCVLKLFYEWQVPRLIT